MRFRPLILLFSLLAIPVASRAQYAGPVSATGLKDSATITYDGNQNVDLAADGAMAIGSGKNVWISKVVIAATTTVYWTPTVAGISLDDRVVSDGEKVKFNAGASDLAHGVAYFTGNGYLSTVQNPSLPIPIRLRMEVRDDATGAAIALVATNATSSGVGVPMQNGRTHRINLLYQVQVSGNWVSAYDHYNSVHNAPPGGAAAYTFAHGFFYDATPRGISLSKTTLDENTPAGLVATISVTDPNPVPETTTFTFVSGTGSANNANFHLNGANLNSARAFNYEVEPSQQIRLRATNRFGWIEAPLTITINDLNEAPTELKLSHAAVDENAAIGTVIGTLSTTDPDTVQKFRDATFELATPPNDGTRYSNTLFKIDGASLKTAQSFNYENSSFPGGVYHVYVRATDGPTIPSAQRKQIAQAFQIQINDRNDPPVAQALTLTAFEDQPLTLPWTTFAGKISDEDSGSPYPNTLSQVVLGSLPTKGKLRYHGADATLIGYTQTMLGNLSYQGSANFNGTDTFEWKAYDGQATGPAATVTVTVVPVNDAPSFNALPNLTIDEDQFNSTFRSITLDNLSPGPPDESTQTITISGTVVSVTGPGSANGLVSNLSSTGTDFRFRTVPDGYGTAVIRVTARDDGGTANGGVDTFSREFTLTINPVDDPPVKTADIPAQLLNENDPPRTIDLSQYFKDVDSPLTFVVTGNTKDAGSGNAIPSLVTTSINGSTLTLTPVDYSYGSGIITVEARGADAQNPGVVRTASGSFTLQVENVDHPPQVGAAAPASLSFNEDAGTVTLPIDNWFFDPDLDTFSNVIVELSSIDPAYFVVNATNAARTGTTEGAIRGSLTVTLTPNAFTAYTAANGTVGNGTTSLRLTATANGRSVSHTVPITIVEINDPPTLAIIGDQLVEEGTQPHLVALTGIGPGPGEAAIDHVTSVTATGGAGGVIDPASVAVTALNLANGTAQLTYALREFQFGADTITVTLADARGGVTSQTFTVKANHVNQAPRARSPLPEPFASAPRPAGVPVLTFLEDQLDATIDASALFWDPDGDTLRQSVFANTVPSLLALVTPSASSGLWNVNLQPNQNGTTNLILRATDGFLTGDFAFSVTVVPVNDPPTLDPIAAQRINQGAPPRTIALSGLGTGPANEADQSLVGITATVVASSIPDLITSVTASLPAGGANGSNGSLTFAVAEARSGTATIRVTVQDNGGTANGGVDTAWREFTVTVNPVDDAPTRQRLAGIVTVLEDQFAATNHQATFDLTGNFADRARDPITLRIIRIDDPKNVIEDETPGRVAVPPTAPESIVVTFLPDAHGTAAITYGATAKGLNSIDEDVLTIVVTPVNDAPRMRAPAALIATQGRVGPYTIPLRDISPGPADESAQVVTVTGVEVIAQSVEGLIASAAIVPGAPPSLSYTIAPNLAGTATLRVTLRDDGGAENGGVDTATFDFPVTVTRVDSPPVRTGSFPDQNFLEDQFAANRYETTLDLTGLFTDPDGDPVVLLLTPEGIHDPKDILDDEDRLVVVDGANPQRLNLTFRPDAHGEATITVGAAAGTLTSKDTFTFKITVDPVNDAPTLAPLANLALTAGSGAQTVALTGISPGPPQEHDQIVTRVTASVVNSSTPDLIDPDSLAVSYTPGATTGTLSFTPGAGLTGTATIAVTAEDNGGIAHNGVNTFTRQFIVTVALADRPPVLTAPIGKITFSEDEFPSAGVTVRQVDLTGVFTDPDNDPISLVINSIADPDNILADRDVAIDEANPQAINLPVIGNTFGTAVIRYRAVAARKLSADYDELTIEITPSNDAPRLNAIPDQTVHEDSVPPIVLLTGISPGANEDASHVTVTASIVQQSPANLIQNLTVNYVAPATTGSLSYTLGQDLAGQAIVRVTVNDGHGLTFSRQFDIYVLGADDVPVALVAADNFTLLEDQRDDGSQTVAVPYTAIFNDPEQEPLTLLVDSIVDPANVVDDEKGGVFVSEDAPMSLQLRLNPNAHGIFSVVTAVHAGSRVSHDKNTRTFTVLPVNDAPTATWPENRNVPEGSAPAVFQVSAIAPGPANESAQTVTSVTAAVDPALSTAGLVTSVTTDYTPGDTTATVTVSFAPRVAGNAQIKVTLRDDGGSANGGADTAGGSFLVSVTPVADPPELVDGREETFVAFSTDALPPNRQVEIDLNGVFVDHDGDPIQLVLRSISDPEHILEDDVPGGIVFAPDDPQKLHLIFSPESYGEAVIEFQALAGGTFSTETAKLRILLTPPLGRPSFDPVADQIIAEGTAQLTLRVNAIRGGLPPPDPAVVQTLTAQIVSASPENLFAAITSADIDYTAGASTGDIRLHPATKLAGTATLRISVTDNGTASATRATSFSQDVTLTVTPQDDPPRLVGNPDLTLTVNEDHYLAAGGITRLDFTGKFVDDDGDPVSVRLINLDDPDNVLDNENGHTITDPLDPQKLILAFHRDAFGKVSFDVIGVARNVPSFEGISVKIEVNPVNDAPTLDALPTLTITEQQAGYTVPLTGISVGPANESAQTIVSVTPSIVSSTPANLLTNLVVTPGADDSTRTLSFALGARYGSAIVRLAVKDSGGTADGGVDTVFRQFAVNVNIADNPPAVVPAQVPAPLMFREDEFAGADGITTVNLAGSFHDPDGPADNAVMTYVLGAITDGDDILADEQPGAIALSGPQNATLKLKLRPNAFGSATVRYRASSRGLLATGFASIQITVTPVNDAPTFDAISNVSVPAGSPEKVITVAGLNVGPREGATQTWQNLSVNVVSGPAQFSIAPAISLDASGRTATLRFTPSTTAGTATLQVTARDTGGTADGGVDTFSRTFGVTVTPVDRPPVAAGSPPAFSYDEDQFAATGHVTTEPLPVLFTDPDGDAVTLLLGPIADPDDVLDNEGGGVRLLPDNSLRLAFVPHGHGAATIPVFGFANGRKSEQPQNIVITVRPINDPPLGALPQKILVAQGQHRVAFMLELSSPGPNEPEQRLLGAEAIWVDPSTGAIDVPSLPFQRSGALPVEIDLPGGVDFQHGQLRLTVRDSGGTVGGGNDTLTQLVTVMREDAARPTRIASAPTPTVRRFTLGGTPGLLVDFRGRYEAGRESVQLVPLGLDDPARAIDLARSGVVAGEPMQLFLALSAGRTPGSVTISYAAAGRGALALTPELLTVPIDAGEAAEIRPIAAASALHFRPIATSAADPEVFALTAVPEADFGAMYRWSWLNAGNDAGFGAYETAAPEGTFAAPALQVAVTDGTTTRWETVSRGAFVRRRAEQQAERRAAVTNDDDGDGIPALLEELIGLDPTRRDGAVLHPTVVREHGRDWLEFRYSRMRSRVGGVLQLERLDEQSRWVPDLTPLEILESHDESDLVRVLYPLDAGRPVLIRLRAALTE